MVLKTINIIYSRPTKTFGALSPELAQMITAVSSKIRLVDVSKLVEAEMKGDLPARKELDAILSQAEIMYGFPPPPNLLVRAPGLKWIQNPLAGVEMFLKPDFIASPVILTNARGIHDQVAEIAFMLALMLAKQAPACLNNQADKRWAKFTPGILSGKTMGILGLGHIGIKLARLAKAFHMRVIVTEIKSIRKPNFVDTLLPAEKLPELLKQSDFVIVAIPLTRETTKLLNEKELKLMRPSAFLINISRGGVIDEAVMVRALKENWISGAGLDVFSSEPLDKDSPLWTLPNVILTPHVAGLREDYDILTAQLFCKNLKRYMTGKELLNVVDKIKGF
jgi:phosphoglycerate dehydrogenase-like enzyme